MVADLQRMKFGATPDKTHDSNSDSWNLPQILSFAKSAGALELEDPACWGTLLPGDVLYCPPQSVVIMKVTHAPAIFLRAQGGYVGSHRLAREPCLTARAY